MNAPAIPICKYFNLQHRYISHSSKMPFRLLLPLPWLLLITIAATTVTLCLPWLLLFLWLQRFDNGDTP
jgi:hypothetical protein